MTKEQIDECEKLGIKHAAQIGKEFTAIELANMPYLMSRHSFAIGFTAGIESEKQRAQVLVEALELQHNACECGTIMMTGTSGMAFDIDLHEEIEKALAKYQKGDE